MTETLLCLHEFDNDEAFSAIFGRKRGRATGIPVEPEEERYFDAAFILEGRGKWTIMLEGSQLIFYQYDDLGNLSLKGFSTVDKIMAFDGNWSMYFAPSPEVLLDGVDAVKVQDWLQGRKS